jgi:phosphatidylserine/phosphatidylglycerophosphate/cardiolipin synthase-like enzyme
MGYIVRRILWIVVAAVIWSAVTHHGGVLASAWHSAGNSMNSMNSMASEVRPSASVKPGATTTLADGKQVSVGFSPGNAELLVIQTIDQAHRSIDVAAYSFTSTAIATALERAAGRGVTIRVVMDKNQARTRFSPVSSLARSGISIRLNDQFASMHDKFMVVDGTTVETGSFNYTRSAQARNAENVIVLRDAPAIARSFDTQWESLWSDAGRVPRANEAAL